MARTIVIRPPESWIDRRLGVGSSLLILYFFHFLFVLLGYLKRVKAEELVQVQKRMHTFGIACLLSLAFLQASVFQTIFSWFNAVVLIFLHMMSFENASKFLTSNKNGLWIIYYAFQFAWYVGIIVQFYELKIDT